MCVCVCACRTVCLCVCVCVCLCVCAHAWVWFVILFQQLTLTDSRMRLHTCIHLAQTRPLSHPRSSSSLPPCCRILVSLWFCQAGCFPNAPLATTPPPITRCTSCAPSTLMLAMLLQTAAQTVLLTHMRWRGRGCARGCLAASTVRLLAAHQHCSPTFPLPHHHLVSFDPLFDSLHSFTAPFSLLYARTRTLLHAPWQDRSLGSRPAHPGSHVLAAAPRPWPA